MRFQLLLVGGLFIPRVSPTRHTCLSIRSILLIFNRDREGEGEDSSSKEEENGNEEDGDSRTILTFEKLMPRPHARNFVPNTICCSKMSKSDPFFVSESEELERPLPLTRVSGANIKEKEVNRGALNK